jgi:hypothetical protein
MTLALFASATNALPAAQAEPDDKNKIICKATGVTGSRVRAAKVCRTRAEWTALEEASRKRLNEFRGNARSTMRGSGF